MSENENQEKTMPDETTQIPTDTLGDVIADTDSLDETPLPEDMAGSSGVVEKASFKHSA